MFRLLLWWRARLALVVRHGSKLTGFLHVSLYSLNKNHLFLTGAFKSPPVLTFTSLMDKRTPDVLQLLIEERDRLNKAIAVLQGSEERPKSTRTRTKAPSVESKSKGAGRFQSYRKKAARALRDRDVVPPPREKA